MKKIIMSIIGFYKRGISPYLGSNCRFYPTCSGYAQLAIERKGVIKGLWMSCLRLLKCHPFHPGGVDDVQYRTGNGKKFLVSPCVIHAGHFWISPVVGTT